MRRAIGMTMIIIIIIIIIIITILIMIFKLASKALDVIERKFFFVAKLRRLSQLERFVNSEDQVEIKKDLGSLNLAFILIVPGTFFDQVPDVVSNKYLE